jgi:hypothetical protein
MVHRKFLIPLMLLLGLLIMPILLGVLIPLASTSPAGAQEYGDTQYCPSPGRAMNGVWTPGRLGVLNTCQQASGTVLMAEPEPDGDLDLYVDLDSQYDQLAGSTTELDALHEWGPGDVLVELMPRDGGSLPAPSEGDHLDLMGAWVNDGNHGYNEIHPTWAESINGEATHTSGPDNGGSLPQSTDQTAATDCKTGSGDPCVGYSG